MFEQKSREMENDEPIQVELSVCLKVCLPNNEYVIVRTVIIYIYICNYNLIINEATGRGTTALS